MSPFGTIRNHAGETLDHRFHQAAEPVAGNHVLVIGHGVTANLDRPWAEALANAAANAGIHALRFSFAGNGASEGDFRDCTITKEVADLGAVLDAVEGAGFTASYAGHSMGGAVGLIRTPEDARIRHFVSLAGMVDTRRFAETEFGDQVPDKGFLWDEPECPLSGAFMDDLRSLGHLGERAARLTVPLLLVHGEEDDLVPVSEARDVFARAGEPKQLVVLEGVNHVFGGAEERMTDAVVAWLLGQLR